MDYFGIGTALKAVFEQYLKLARGTGRTKALVDGLKDGDRVVCRSPIEKKMMERMIEEKGVEARVEVIDFRNPSSILDRKKSRGRTIFDHMWVEDFHRNRIDEGIKFLDMLAEETSTLGASGTTDRVEYKFIGSRMPVSW